MLTPKEMNFGILFGLTFKMKFKMKDPMKLPKIADKKMKFPFI